MAETGGSNLGAPVSPTMPEWDASGGLVEQVTLLTRGMPASSFLIARSCALRTAEIILRLALTKAGSSLALRMAAVAVLMVSKATSCSSESYGVG